MSIVFSEFQWVDVGKSGGNQCMKCQQMYSVDNLHQKHRELENLISCQGKLLNVKSLYTCLPDEIQHVQTKKENVTLPLTHLCPGKDYWADFLNFLHMNPCYGQMEKYHITWTLPNIVKIGEVWIFCPLPVHFHTARHKWVNKINLEIVNGVFMLHFRRKTCMPS